MKITRINIDGTMNDIDIPSSTKKNILRNLKKEAIQQGDSDLKELYRWNINTNL